MTMQAPDVMERDEGAIELPRLQLFGVLVGDIDDPRSSTTYPFSYQGNRTKIVMCTALWRGYISAYLLRADGRLVLKRAVYPFTPNADPDVVNEELVGDFWIDLREWFMGCGVRVPFRQGRIVADESEWRTLE